MSENAQTVKIHIARIAGLRPCQPCVNRWWKSQAYRPQTTSEINSLGSPEKDCAPIDAGRDEPKSTPAVNSGKPTVVVNALILSNAERAGRSFWKPASFDFDLMLFAWMRKSTPAPKARGHQADTDEYRCDMDGKGHPRKYGGKRCFGMTQQEGDQKRQQGEWCYGQEQCLIAPPEPRDKPAEGNAPSQKLDIHGAGQARESVVHKGGDQQ